MELNSVEKSEIHSNRWIFDESNTELESNRLCTKQSSLYGVDFLMKNSKMVVY